MGGLGLCFQMRGFPKRRNERFIDEKLFFVKKRNVVEEWRNYFWEKENVMEGMGRFYFFGKRLM